MNNVKVTYKSDTKEFPKGTIYQEICESFGVAKNSLAVKIDNDIFGLTEKCVSNETFEVITKKSIDGYLIYKSGVKFIFEVALKTVFPDADVSFEHSVPNGMLACIDYKKNLTQENVYAVRSEMTKIINENALIKRITVLKKEAIDFYNKRKEFEKADNVSNSTNTFYNLYELKGVYNYFYSNLPYSTEVIDKYNIVYLGNNRIVFVLPSKKVGYDIPEYVHYDGIINTFFESKEWLENQKMKYVTNLNLKISSNKIKDFMKSNEVRYNINLSKVAEKIVSDRNIKFIMVAGPSSSGKTTTTKRLATFLEALGHDTIQISVDNYFVDRENSPKDEDGNFDFECLQSIDLDYLNSDLQKLLNGEIVNMPEFNFISGKKEPGSKSVKMKDNTLIIMEGLHTLNDELVPNIDNKLKYKIYLSPFLSLNIDRHNYVSTLDLRLLRRIVRDNRTRGYGVATTIHNWQVVRNGEEKYIFPYIHQADTIIDTALAYEVGVLRVYVVPLLLSVGIDSAYHSEAQRLLCFLSQFFPIPGEYVDRNSILREFIGGLHD